MPYKPKKPKADSISAYAKNRMANESKAIDLANTIRSQRITLSDVQKGYAEEGRVAVRLSDNTVIYARPGQTKEQVRAKYQKSII